MRKLSLLLLLLPSVLQAQFKLDSADYVRQYGINSHWKNPFLVAPDSQFLMWGYNVGGPGSVAKYTLLKTDTLKFFWVTAPISAWSIWSCNSVWSKGVNKSQCNSFNRPATILTAIHDTVVVRDTVRINVATHDTIKVPSGFIHDTTTFVHDTTKFVFVHDTIFHDSLKFVHDTTFIHDTVKVLGVEQWVFPRDSVVYKHYVSANTCDGTRASIDSITGMLNLGCNLGKHVMLADGTLADSGVPALMQMCMVSILSDSSVIWAKQSKNVCPDSVPRKKYGARWKPALGVDTALTFELAGARWH